MIHFVCVIVNTDRSTWPSGDKVWSFCQAIALAEGYNIANSVPARLHNPGDISDESHIYGAESHDGSSVTTFPSDSVGWNYLYIKIHNALTGHSHVYSPVMTFLEFAQKFAGDSEFWVRNVCLELGVSPSDTIGVWFNRD